MTRFSEASPKSFNLLSIGQRGVGKTVFLAGSYAELHPEDELEPAPHLWFDCQDRQSQENIDAVLNYVAQTGQYPPPTMKMTSFNFSLKQHWGQGEKTLCHFRWWDIPGEISKLESLDFQTLVCQSHACCIFIDALQLAQDPEYLRSLDPVLDQVLAIASLVQVNQLPYAFALVLTKSDLVPTDVATRDQLAQGIQSLTSPLAELELNHHLFYSMIPIRSERGKAVLKAEGAAAAFLWLGSELGKIHDYAGLLGLLPESMQRSPIQRVQPWQYFSQGMLASSVQTGKSRHPGKTWFGLYLPLAIRRPLAQMALPAAGLVVLALGLLFSYQLPALQPLSFWQSADSRLKHLEQLVQAQPERLELKLQLADQYRQAGELAKAEAIYDQVLAQEQTNLDALVGKAIVRNTQGDVLAATRLFDQAEGIAPSNLKPKIRALAQATLQPAVPPQ